MVGGGRRIAADHRVLIEGMVCSNVRPVWEICYSPNKAPRPNYQVL